MFEAFELADLGERLTETRGFDMGEDRSAIDEGDRVSNVADPVLLILLTLRVPCVFLLLEPSCNPDLFQTLISESS